MCLWKTTPASALLSFPPSRLPTAAPSLFFLWVGGGTNYSQRGHIARANSLSRGGGGGQDGGIHTSCSGFYGKLYLRPASPSLSSSLSQPPIHPPPASQTGFMVGLRAASTQTEDEKALALPVPQTQAFMTLHRISAQKPEKAATAQIRPILERRIPGRFRWRCYCHSQTTSPRARNICLPLWAKNCPTTGEKLFRVSCTIITLWVI